MSYDALGNIVRVTTTSLVEGVGTTWELYSYSYDSLGQLLRENNNATNKTYVYTYDKNGNILSEKIYAYTVGEITGEPITQNTYTYGNSNWLDQLTSYNGNAITYDEMGNPVSYLGYTMGWENVNNLVSVSGNGTSVQYKYNDEGIRTHKIIGDTVKKYSLEGNTIMFETSGTTVLAYIYDETGSPIGFAYRKGATANENEAPSDQFVKYLFTKNLQGDILNIYDESGTKVAEYIYDAWGNHTVNNLTSDNIGNINPFRYRGYYYDTETGFYYLNSRYYDPAIKRFISNTALDEENIGLDKIKEIKQRDIANKMVEVRLSNISSKEVDNSLKQINFFGYELRESSGWENSSFVYSGLWGRIGHSQYITHYEGQKGYVYVFAGSEKDLLNMAGIKYFAGIGINFFDVFTCESSLENVGVKQEIKFGKTVIAINVNFMGGTSIMFGKETDIGNGYIKTEGAILEINTGFLFAVACAVFCGMRLPNVEYAYVK